MLEIQLAVQNNVKTFMFEGSELTLKPTCNVFITMNPDYAMISEIMLYSSGYLQVLLIQHLLSIYLVNHVLVSSETTDTYENLGLKFY